MNHTPGPWEIVLGRGLSPNGARIQSPAILNGKNVVRPVTDVTRLYQAADKPLDQKMADARLIAAAPDGLVVAKMAYVALLHVPVDSILRTKTDSVRAALRDFIAKAEGRDEEEVQNEYESFAQATAP